MKPVMPWLTRGAASTEPATLAAETGPYVLNLCSSTTPLALAQIDREELKRFTFFVTRRFEEGRERFRLHMGYFANLAEARKWLPMVRDIYPSAWAGAAPEQKPRSIGTSQVDAPLARARAADPAAVRNALASSAAVPTARASRPARPSNSETRDSSTRRTTAPQPAGRKPSATQRMASAPVLGPRAGERPAHAPGNQRRPQRESRAAKRPAREATGRIPLLTAAEPSFAAAHDSAVFVVHLISVAQPEDIGIIPRLPIFDSYTLYTIQGHHEGRKWYGLRLGFFSDARFARQVAHQLRQEFGDASVVSVSSEEQAGVSGEQQHPDPGYAAQEDEPREPRARKSSRPVQPASRWPGAGETSEPAYDGLEDLEEGMEIVGESFDQVDDELPEDYEAEQEPEVTRRSPFARLLGALTDRIRR
jgi:hypothetical protein